MKQLILYGAGLIAAESFHYLERHGRGSEVVCFAVTSRPSAAAFCGRPIFAAEDALARFPEAEVLVTLQEKYHDEVRCFLAAHGREAVAYWGLQHATSLLRAEGVARLSELPDILAEEDAEDYSMLRVARREAPDESFRLYPMTQVPLSSDEEEMLPRVMTEEFPEDFGAYPAADWKLLFIAAASSVRDAAVEQGTLPSYLHPVLGGAALAETVPQGMLRDDAGRNISKDNRLYSELSVTYWLSQNPPDAAYLGLFHYRRQLVLTEELKEALFARRVDVILPRPRLTFPDVKTLFLRPTMGTLSERDYDRMMALLDQQSPAIAACARRVFAHRVHLPANILIARREVFCDYADFLFGILQAVQAQNEADGIEQEPRSLGYLGELLTTLYFAYHHETLRMQYTDCHLMAAIH